MSKQSAPLWDIPIRVCHWLFVVVIAFSWWSAEYDHLEWHLRSGYTLLGLLLFRIVWGIIGSQSARFTHFIKSPGAVIAYARTLFKRPAPLSAGHNPMGGWSVILLLTLMLVQVCLGLISEDVDGLASGPLSYKVSYDLGRWAAETHEELFDVLLVFIALHVSFVLFYQFYKKDNLIVPMFKGSKAGVDTSQLKQTAVWIALIIAALSATAVWWLVT